MFTEENLLQLSGLQHLSFCPRRWGLVHLEGLWEENILTMEGKFFHEKADEHGTEVRVDTRIARGLRLRSLKYGLSGKTDVVEFHRTESNKGIKLKGVSGLWVPFPVEYKSGSPKTGNWYEVQLCAQALCLEEMLSVTVSKGAIFYGKTRRRKDIVFGLKLRSETETLINKLHEFYKRGVTPPPEYSSKCERCSMKSNCLPNVTDIKKSARLYINRFLGNIIEGGDKE